MTDETAALIRDLKCDDGYALNRERSIRAASVIEELESKLDRIQDAYAESVDDELEYNLGNILKGA